MSLSKIFKNLQEKLGITNKQIGETGVISTKHLSQFRNGKSDISASLLWSVLEEMEKIQEGAIAEMGAEMMKWGNQKESQDSSFSSFLEENGLNEKVLCSLLGCDRAALAGKLQGIEELIALRNALPAPYRSRLLKWLGSDRDVKSWIESLNNEELAYVFEGLAYRHRLMAMSELKDRELIEIEK